MRYTRICVHMRVWTCARTHHERVGQAASLLRRGDNDYSDMARPLAQCCWDNHSGLKDSDPPLLARGRGGWVSCVVLGVLPSRGSSLLAVLCPEGAHRLSALPSSRGKRKNRINDASVDSKESAVDDYHVGSPLRGAGSESILTLCTQSPNSPSRVSVHRPMTRPLGTRGDSRRSHPGVTGHVQPTPPNHL